MTRLTRTHVDHYTVADIETVEFTTDAGAVNISRNDEGVTLEIGYEEVEAEEMAELLNEVADDEHMDADALAVAFDMVSDAADDTEDTEDNEATDENETAEPDDSEPEVVHTLEDGTEIRVGDRINHRDGSTYKITGRASDHTLSKSDISDSGEITLSRVTDDVQQRGFAERGGQ